MAPIIFLEAERSIKKIIGCFLHIYTGNGWKYRFKTGCLEFQVYLGGGFKDFWNFHPETWGNDPI